MYSYLTVAVQSSLEYYYRVHTGHIGRTRVCESFQKLYPTFGWVRLEMIVGEGNITYAHPGAFRSWEHICCAFGEYKE